MPARFAEEAEVSGGEFDATYFSESHELSADGSVFFSYNGHLYLHDFAKDDAVRLDVAQGVAEPSKGEAGVKTGVGRRFRVLLCVE